MTSRVNIHTISHSSENSKGCSVYFNFHYLCIIIAAMSALFCINLFESARAATPIRSSNPREDLVYASFRDITELNPYLCNDSSSKAVTNLVYQGLLVYSPDLILVPGLAKSWTISQDQKTIILELAENILWHDLKPFTSADVVHSINTARSRSARATYYNDFKMVNSVQPLGPHRVSITWSDTFAPALGSLTMPIIPAHIPFEALTSTPVGTGPYMFQNSALSNSSLKSTSEAPLVLVAFDRYHGQEATLSLKNHLTAAETENGPSGEYPLFSPQVKRILFHTSRDQNNLLSLLLAGAVDVAELNHRQYDSVKSRKGFDERFQVLSSEKLHYTFLAFNLNRKPYSIPEFRKAIALTLDREAMIKDILRGYGKIVTGPFPGLSWASDPKIRAYPHNPEEARQLLDKAGFTRNGSELLYDGKPVTMNILTNKGETAREETARMVAAQLADIGIKVTVTPLEWKFLVKKHINRHDFDALIMGWSLDPDPDCYSIWHSSQCESGQMNFTGYSNPAVDNLLEQGRKDFSRNRRQKIYREIHDILHRDLPYVFLYSPMDMTAVSRKFQDIPLSPLGILRYLSQWNLAR
ncbi:MAG: hypothetical protein CVV64_08815 [Candidatus Wallbacteria bacterium HGW-Wallbacteria-1]|jgi:peptide/nickel transport system substrate-binding protein|uniref:Solute-binding protein family 5 domain-containing protein n=1 Tax=Candidatus Wallbacteria bacterium HGW-Wallbacteria-1 TaxID=2013854 RepID=A0A2N1PQ45_9BACT|nr:MAG: hypothetical protein CVV64_08815 [Candidatus Wallbacteria bacterium HGW-Wallbacteria-1]